MGQARHPAAIAAALAELHAAGIRVEHRSRQDFDSDSQTHRFILRLSVDGGTGCHLQGVLFYTTCIDKVEAVAEKLIAMKTDMFNRAQIIREALSGGSVFAELQAARAALEEIAGMSYEQFASETARAALGKEG